MERTVKLYSFSLARAQAWLLAAIFVAGNIALPRLCHLIPMGGPTWLPIYFFTLIAAYKYGPGVGLLTAVCSPVLNHLLFGMPAVDMLAPVLVKGVALALAAAYAAKWSGKVSLIALVGAVLAYQAVGTAAEWAIVGDWGVALNDLRVGFPGMLVQIFGGWAVLKALQRV